jgi:hypothetical protein
VTSLNLLTAGSVALLRLSVYVLANMVLLVGLVILVHVFIGVPLANGPVYPRNPSSG